MCRHHARHVLDLLRQYVTFDVSSPPNLSSDSVHQDPNAEEASTLPEACEINGHYNWQSVQIRQPSNGLSSYTVDFFSGEGCNNPISTFSEDGCYTRKRTRIEKIMPVGHTLTSYIRLQSQRGSR
jgi:hypothetical protein